MTIHVIWGVVIKYIQQYYICNMGGGFINVCLANMTISCLIFECKHAMHLVSQMLKNRLDTYIIYTCVYSFIL